MKGKDKCNYLKQLRNKMAKENNIDYHSDECKFKGECLGTCPKCEAELKELTRKINEKKRRKLIAGIGVGVAALGLVGCTDNIPDNMSGSVEVTPAETGLSGGVALPEKSLLDKIKDKTKDTEETKINETDVIDETSETELLETMALEGDVECPIIDISTEIENIEESEESETIPTNYDLPVTAGVAPPENWRNE